MFFISPFSYIFSNWTQIGNDIDGECRWNYSGHSVAISDDGTIMVIGAYSNYNYGVSNQVVVYQNIGGSWIQLGQDI